MRDTDSCFTPASVQAMAQIACLNSVSVEAARALAPDLDYRLREIIQDAQKFARHAKRTKLTTEDINNALRIRNHEPMFGYMGSQGATKGFVRVPDHPEISVAKDREVTCDQVSTECQSAQRGHAHHRALFTFVPCHALSGA